MPKSPGVTFETVAPAPTSTLPRMDIAGFVGFASRGPVNVPVPVEDSVRFRDVFGPPLDLARDVDTGRTLTAHLGRAVDAFFENGGRRCWVVRVAHPADGSGDGPAVERTRFPVPGLISINDGVPPLARARSYGTTFDSHRVGTVLNRVLLAEPSSVRWDNPGFTLSWAPDRPDAFGDLPLDEGDLVRLATNDGLLGYAPVTSPPQFVATGPGPSRSGEVRMATGPAHLFQRDPIPLVPDWEHMSSSRGTDIGVGLTVQTTTGLADDSFALRLRRLNDERGDDRFAIVVPAGHTLRPEDLEQEQVQLEAGGGSLTGWLRLGAVGKHLRALGETEVSVREALWPIERSAGAATLVSSTVSVERLRFDLLVWQGQELLQRLDGLGFASSHSRAWSSLPTDGTLFGFEPGEPTTPEQGSLAADVFEPRFPLAGPEDSEPALYIPLAMSDRPAYDRTRGRVEPASDLSRLERERLATFSTELFVDSEGAPPLAEPDTATLAEAAKHRFYLDESGPTPPVTGLHTLWPMDEVTLLACPDAVHRGWDEPIGVTPTAASRPVLPPPAVDYDSDPPVVHLSWPADRLDREDVHVELQEATEPEFGQPALRYEGSDTSVDRYVRSDTAVILFYRYRIVTDGQPGAWSNTRSVTVPQPDLAACRERPSTVLLSRAGRNWIYWRPWTGAGGEVAYEFEVAPSPHFQTPSRHSQGLDALPDAPSLPTGEGPSDPGAHAWFSVEAGPQTPAIQYVRVRVRQTDGGGEAVSGWSNTVAVIRPVENRSPVVPPSEYDEPRSDTPGGGRDGLLGVQAAMLRFSAARGDVFSVLSLPEHDQPETAEEHVGRLRTPGMHLNYGEERTLSFGGVYFPWILGTGRDAATRPPIPPDGPTAGVIAAQSIAEGAWMAPANRSMANAHGVVPALDEAYRQSLAPIPINVYLDAPAGVRTLGASTLARNPDLEPVSTRRLLSLLRRLVEREGPALVFENNGSRLRRRVAEQFDGVLRRLFRRGAFAGETPAQAFRVVADDSVNPPAQVERGRLFLELRVAPARPLQFLTVRLIQRSGQSPLVTDEGSRVPSPA